MNHIIVRKKNLSKENFLIEIKAPHVAERFQPGQFVIIRISETGERIPLTVADVNKAAKTITLIFQAVGRTTMELSTLNKGDPVLNCVGPLGNPSEIKKFGQVACVGGGTGIACIYPLVQALAKAGNEVTAIIGARNESMLILEKDMKAAATKTLIATDDGSKGHHGFVTEVLHKTIEAHKNSGGISRVITIGPIPMMKAAAEVTRPYKIPTIASLNTIMVDGTGMCGSCRAYIDGVMKLACIDGPEFDAHKVDFDDVLSRMEMFKVKEKRAVEHYQKISLEKE